MFFPGPTFWSPRCRWIPSLAQLPAAGCAAPSALRLRAEAGAHASQGDAVAIAEVDDGAASAVGAVGAGAGQRLRGGRIGGGSTWGAGENMRPQ